MGSLFYYLLLWPWSCWTHVSLSRNTIRGSVAWKGGFLSTGKCWFFWNKPLEDNNTCNNIAGVQSQFVWLIDFCVKTKTLLFVEARKVVELIGSKLKCLMKQHSAHCAVLSKVTTVVGKHFFWLCEVNRLNKRDITTCESIQILKYRNHKIRFGPLNMKFDVHQVFRTSKLPHQDANKSWSNGTKTFIWPCGEIRLPKEQQLEGTAPKRQ